MIHLARGNRRIYTKVAEKYSVYLNKLQLRRNELGPIKPDRMASSLNTIITRVWFNLRESKEFKEFVSRIMEHNLNKTKVTYSHTPLHP